MFVYVVVKQKVYLSHDFSLERSLLVSKQFKENNVIDLLSLIIMASCDYMFTGSKSIVIYEVCS